MLLFGPIGSGKSTELLRFNDLLEKGKVIFPLLLNVRGEIDINNLQYTDILLALAKVLVRTLEEKQINLSGAALEPLQKWFVEEVYTDDSTREISGEITTEGMMKGGIPLLVQLLGRVTATMKGTSENKTSMREVVKKTFTQFSDAFNQLTQEAEKKIKARNLGQRILFIVDGTDKIPLQDAKSLFVYDTEQLLAIKAYVVYTAPIALKYRGAGPSRLDAEEVLPIVKLYERSGGKHEAGWSALRELLSRRIDPASFQDAAATPDELMDLLIDASGGHPRELLRLLRLSCELAVISGTDTINTDVIDQAIEKLTGDFRYWLSKEDYSCLAEIDASGGVANGNNEQISNLMYRLALLQYNNGSWRQSNPVIRRLAGYQSATAQLDNPHPPCS
ncbi:hypothetical protein LJC47_04450 [Desulfosarcina sp. OttesenSCG-928-B08]|nr:hypothetical protein [Desulfosarcina sp. OttesenSCG-928-B08]